MGRLLRRHYWVVRLVEIALIALLVALGVNDEVSSRLFAPPERATAGWDADEDDEPGELGRVARDEAATELLSARHVFGVEAQAPPAPPTPPPAPPAAGGPLAETSLAVSLVGTMVSEEPTSSIATLQVAGQNRFARCGSEILGGEATVVEIAPRLVVLEEKGGERTVVRLWDADGTAKGPVPKTAAAKPAAGPTRADPPRDPGFASWIQRSGPGSYTIDRARLDQRLSDPASLQRDARAVPSYRDRAYHGIKLVGVRPGGLYRALGLRSGDVLTAVNGQRIDSPTRGLALYEQLRSASTVELRVERYGREKTLRYTIR